MSQRTVRANLSEQEPSVAFDLNELDNASMIATNWEANRQVLRVEPIGKTGSFEYHI